MQATNGIRGRRPAGAGAWTRLRGMLLPAAVLSAVALLAGCGGDEGITQLAAGIRTCKVALATTYVGGNSHNGNVFSVVTQGKAVTLGRIDGHPADVAGTSTAWEIWYKPGTYIGFQTDPAAWTLAGTASGVLAAGAGLPTPLPIPLNIVLPPASTTSFLVTRSDGGFVSYTNLVSEGGVFAEDPFLAVLEGRQQIYPFAGGAGLRMFNGTLHYTVTGEGIACP